MYTLYIVLIKINVTLVTDGHIWSNGEISFHKRGESLRRGPRGKYSWVLIKPSILKSIIDYELSNFPFECIKAQSLNTCKRVCVKSHMS
jgi:hypothetical protein